MDQARIVMVCYSRRDLTERTLASYAETTRTPHRLILIDNGSTDGTIDLLRTWALDAHPFSVEVIERNNEGKLAGAIDYAWREYDQENLEEFVGLVGNDALFQDGWLETMLDAMQQHPGLGALASRIRVNGSIVPDDTLEELTPRPVGEKVSTEKIMPSRSLGTLVTLARSKCIDGEMAMTGERTDFWNFIRKIGSREAYNIAYHRDVVTEHIGVDRRCGMLDPKAPIIIGGIGGSGTRIVARLVHALGVFFPWPMNDTHDNMALEAQGFRDNDMDRATQTITEQLEKYEGDASLWAMKAPTSLIYLPEVALYYPGMRYIHVMRHGLDMVWSQQQHQIKYHYAKMDMIVDSWRSLSDRLEFWLRANLTARQARVPKMTVRFEDILADPDREVERIAAFIGADGTVDTAFVQDPGTVGRYKKYDLRVFYPKQIDELRKLGYEVDKAALASGGENTMATEAAMNAPTGPD